MENKKTLDDNVNRLIMAEGLDFMTAACRVASWEIMWHVLGPAPYDDAAEIERDAIEVEIQEILRRVFSSTEMAS